MLPNLPTDIPGVSWAGEGGVEPPQLLVLGPEKSGKSTLSTTLIGWPEPDKYPLVLAFDPTGPDSTAGINLPVPVLKVKNESGATYWDKTQSAIAKIERPFLMGKRPYGSIVVDCGSKMSDHVFADSRGMRKAKDPRQNYGELLERSGEVYQRLSQLGVPVIWLAWLREPWEEQSENQHGQKVKRLVLGGPLMMGQFRSRLAGSVNQILVLEKKKIAYPAGTPIEQAMRLYPGMCADGWVRVFHTKTWANIEAGGRYGAIPEELPAHLGSFLDLVMKRGAHAPPPPAFAPPPPPPPVAFAPPPPPPPAAQ